MTRLIPAMILLALPVAANAMPVSTFITKGNALEKKGPMALFSSDLGVLKAEVQSAGKQIRNERLAAVKDGRRPNHCPRPKAGFTPQELLAYLRTIPPAQRGMSFKTAYAMFLAKTYPCPPAG